MNQELDEVRLQRLVDGVLNDVERRDFLASLEDRPEHWREVALAFVEEQIWSDVVRAPEAKPSNVSPAKSEPIPVKDRMSWLQRIAMAACLLVVLGAGVWIGQWKANRSATPSRDGHRTDNQIVEVDPNATNMDAEPLDDEAFLRPERLQIDFGDGPSLQSLVVPVYHESQMADAAWDEDLYAAEIERINRQLAPRGYRVELQTEYLGGSLSGSNQLVVPVRAISLQQRGQ